MYGVFLFGCWGCFVSGGRDFLSQPSPSDSGVGESPTWELPKNRGP